MASCRTSDLYLTLYRMDAHVGTRDMFIWHYTWWCNVGLMICVSDILQNERHEITSPNMLSFSIMADTQITSPTCLHSVLCPDTLGLVICASDIIQNGRHVGLVICVSGHNTEWRHVGLVICVSAIIENDNMFGLVICVSDIIQNGFMLGLVIVYLTLYRMTPMLD